MNQCCTWLGLHVPTDQLVVIDETGTERVVKSATSVDSF
jgi:hypothetical protein